MIVDIFICSRLWQSSLYIVLFTSMWSTCIVVPFYDGLLVHCNFIFFLQGWWQPAPALLGTVNRTAFIKSIIQYHPSITPSHLVTPFVTSYEHYATCSLRHMMSHAHFHYVACRAHVFVTSHYVRVCVMPYNATCLCLYRHIMSCEHMLILDLYKHFHMKCRGICRHQFVKE